MTLTELVAGPRGAFADGDSEDEVLRLREWGTDRCYELPRTHTADELVGSSVECELRLNGASVLPQHARLSHRSRRWWIRGLGRGCDIERDGTALKEFALEPGVEVGIGSTSLIAESVRSIALREFFARLLGWGCDLSVIDRALRSMRLAMARRGPLILCGVGAGDLVGIAYSLHRRTLGAATPFVTCSPRLGSTPDLARYSASHVSGRIAFDAATGGTLCLRRSHLPHDLTTLIQKLHQPQSRVVLIVCLDRSDRGALLVGPPPIHVPPLGERTSEIPGLVLAYTSDALTTLGAPATSFSDRDLEWVIARAASSLVEIEQATLRIVAIKSSRSLDRAASRLGISKISLTRWFGRRGECVFTYPGATFGRTLPRLSEAPSPPTGALTEAAALGAPIARRAILGSCGGS